VVLSTETKAYKICTPSWVIWSVLKEKQPGFANLHFYW